MVRSVFSEASPAAESNAAFLLSGVSSWPPASQSSASQCQTVSSVPGVTYAVALFERPGCQLLRACPTHPSDPDRARRLHARPVAQRLVVEHSHVLHTARG